MLYTFPTFRSSVMWHLAVFFVLMLACQAKVAAAVISEEVVRMTPLSGEGTIFGKTKVFLSCNTAVVPAIGAFSNRGIVAVNVRQSNNTWMREATLRATTALGTDESADFVYFGHGIAFDKDTIAVTSIASNSAKPVWIFHRIAGVWSLQQRLDLPVGYTKVVVNALENNTLVLTAALGNQDNSLIYERQGNSWTHTGTIYGNSAFATTKLSGKTIVINSTSARELYVYERLENGQWELVSTLTAPESLPSNTLILAPHDVAIDGDTIVMGVAYSNNLNPSLVTGNFGRAYVFQRGVSGWAATSILKPADVTTPNSYDYRFGSVVHINGDIIAVGAPYYDLGNVGGIGAAMVLCMCIDDQLTMLLQPNKHHGYRYSGLPEQNQAMINSMDMV